MSGYRNSADFGNNNSMRSRNIWRRRKVYAAVYPEAARTRFPRQARVPSAAGNSLRRMDERRSPKAMVVSSRMGNAGDQDGSSRQWFLPNRNVPADRRTSSLRLRHFSGG